MTQKVERCRYVRWEAPCVSAAASLDDRLCVCYDDGVCELLTKNLALLRRIYGRRDVVPQCLKFGEKKIFAAAINGAIFQLDFDSLKLGTPTDSGGGAVWALSGDLLAACEDGTVREFDCDLRFKSRRVVVNGGRCVSMCDEYVGGDDGSIRCLDGTMLCPPQPNCVVWCLARASQIVVSGDSLGRVRTWDPLNRVALSEFKRHEADVLCLAQFDDYFYASGVDSKIVCFRGDGRDINPFKSYRAHASDVSSLCVVDKTLVSTSSTESKVCRHDLGLGRTEKHFAYPRLVSAIGDVIAVATRSDVVEVWKPLDCLLRIRNSSRDNFRALAVSSEAVAASDSRATRLLFFDERELSFKPSSAIAFSHQKKSLVLCHHLSSEIVSYSPNGEVLRRIPSTTPIPQLLAAASSSLVATPTSHISFPGNATCISFEDGSETLHALCGDVIHSYDPKAMTLDSKPSPLARTVGFSPPRLVYSRTHVHLDGKTSARYGPVLAATLEDDVLRIFELPLRNNTRRYPPVKRKRFGD